MNNSVETKSARIRTGLALLLLVSTTGYAAAQNAPADVAAACTEQTNAPPALCECVGDSSAELSPDQRAFYVASLVGNDAETTRLRTVLGFDQLTEVVTFIRTAPADCAG